MVLQYFTQNKHAKNNFEIVLFKFILNDFVANSPNSITNI